MPDFTTVPEALHSAGAKASRSVEALHGADCWGPVGQVPGALPGSRAAAAAQSYVEVWTVYFAGWRARAAQYAGSLRAAATSYATVDQRHAAALSAAGGAKPGTSAGPAEPGAFAPGAIAKALG